MPLRVANWNVYHGALNDGAGGITTPAMRMSAFATYCSGLGTPVDIIGFQEVPATTAAAYAPPPGWAMAWMAGGEYPPYPPNPAPASATADVYVVLYNPARAVLAGAPNFVAQANFVVGVAQGRPPVAWPFSNAAGACACTVAVWHNETGAWAQNGITGLHNSYVGLGGNQVILGDFNVNTQTDLQNPFLPGWDAVTDGLDAILANAAAADVVLGPPAPFLSDHHYAMVADINLPW